MGAYTHQLLHSRVHPLSCMRTLHEDRRPWVLDLLRLASLQCPLRSSVFGFPVALQRQKVNFQINVSAHTVRNMARREEREGTNFKRKEERSRYKAPIEARVGAFAPRVPCVDRPFRLSPLSPSLSPALSSEGHQVRRPKACHHTG